MNERNAKLWREFLYLVKYGLVGVVNTGVSALVMWLLSLTGMGYPVYTAIGYVVGIVNSFFLNYKITFQSKESKIVGLSLKFFLVGVVMTLAAEGFQYILISQWKIPELPGVVAGMVLYTCGGFILNRLWVFHKAGETHDQTS